MKPVNFSYSLSPVTFVEKTTSLPETAPRAPSRPCTTLRPCFPFLPLRCTTLCALRFLLQVFVPCIPYSFFVVVLLPFLPLVVPFVSPIDPLLGLLATVLLFTSYLLTFFPINPSFSLTLSVNFFHKI